MTFLPPTRRRFLQQCALTSGAAALSPWSSVFARDKDPVPDWLSMGEDPVYALLRGKPDLEKILALFPPTTGEPAFDRKLIAENIARLKTTPEVNTGHPLLDLSVKTGLAHIDATFQGDHPKYGVGEYGKPQHDGFPPTIIAAVDALTLWGIHARATQLFQYWLAHFVRENGTINYYGPSISEYGQLLHTAAILEQRSGTADWWPDGFKALNAMAEFLLGLHAKASKSDGLIYGGPEADKRGEPGKYFHNNAWVVRGLRDWAALCERCNAAPTTSIDVVYKAATQLAQDTLKAVRKTWPTDPADWWLPPQLEPAARPKRLTGQWDTASYTNYRYWPELLSSGLLPAKMANRIVQARLTAGGQFCGMTRFANHLDDWPLADYLEGVWSLGRKNDFLLSLYGHVAYHQAEGHLTAYEQVTFPPGKKKFDYCLPSQLVAARGARRLVP